MSLQFKNLLQKVTEKLENEILPAIELVHPLPDSLRCCQCNSILKKPQQLSCGHRICLSCVHIFLLDAPVNEDGVKYCAEDEDELDNETFPDNSAMKEIMQLQCYCLRKVDGCDWTGPIMEIEEHLETCKYNVTTECKYKYLGCTFTGTSTNMEQHMKDRAIFHSAFTTVYIANLEAQSKRNKKLANNVEKKTNTLQVSADSLKNSIGSLKKEIEETKDEINSVDNEAIADISKRVELFKSKQHEITKMQDDLLKKTKDVESLYQIVNKSTSANENMTYEQQIAEMDNKLKRLDLVHKQNLDQMKQVELKTKLFQSTTFDGTFIWKLDNLTKRTLAAVTGTTTELITAPLHTSKYGFKFCAKVLLNGHAKLGERSDHVAIYIIIMRGDFDDVLNWPFRNLIKVTLLNVTDKRKNLERVLIPRLDLQHYKKPVRDMNAPIGFPRFCTHDELYSEGFVRDDAVFIKIEVEKEMVG